MSKYKRSGVSYWGQRERCIPIAQTDTLREGSLIFRRRGFTRSLQRICTKIRNVLCKCYKYSADKEAVSWSSKRICKAVNVSLAISQSLYVLLRDCLPLQIVDEREEVDDAIG